MSKPICFKCKHFKQRQPLTFRFPGMCAWKPKEAIPEWLQFWLDGTDRYYGPGREISTVHPVLVCEAYEEKPK